LSHQPKRLYEECQTTIIKINGATEIFEVLINGPVLVPPKDVEEITANLIAASNNALKALVVHKGKAIRRMNETTTLKEVG